MSVDHHCEVCDADVPRHVRFSPQSHLQALKVAINGPLWPIVAPFPPISMQNAHFQP